jgi:hypothetical protein
VRPSRSKIAQTFPDMMVGSPDTDMVSGLPCVYALRSYAYDNEPYSVVQWSRRNGENGSADRADRGDGGGNAFREQARQEVMSPDP